MKEKIYLSGGISGRLLEEVKREFLNKEIELEENGYEVLNPFRNGLDANAPYFEHMLKDIEMLFQADAIYMLRDWNLSDGARVEHFIANTYKKKVFL